MKRKLSDAELQEIAAAWNKRFPPELSRYERYEREAEDADPEGYWKGRPFSPSASETGGPAKEKK